MMKFASFVMISALSIGCTQATTQQSNIRSASAPQLGPADSHDASDHGCNVVLRSVARSRETATGGYETWCGDRGCMFVWRGEFDISRELADAGATASVLFQSSAEPGEWFEALSVGVAGAPDGFQRYAFVLGEHTVSSGMSTTSLMRTQIELVPFVRPAGGGRLFDHNALAGDFENYMLTSSNSWSVTNASTVCPPPTPPGRASVDFEAGWRTAQHGAIVQGGKLTVNYNLYRLPECHNATRYGYAAWETMANLRFLPGGERTETSVRGRRDMFGHDFYSLPLTVDVPTSARSVEMWFYTSGNGCATRYDSNYGYNHSFDVVPAAPAAVAWAGDIGSSFARDCAHRDGVAEPIVMNSYVRERACSFVDVDVFVPGLTDNDVLHPERILASARVTKDASAPTDVWMTFVGRVGNNYRFRWELPRADMTYTAWDRYRYRFRFSTDGNTFYELGNPDGTDRTIDRDPSWTVPAPVTP